MSKKKIIIISIICFVVIVAILIFIGLKSATSDEPEEIEISKDTTSEQQNNNNINTNKNDTDTSNTTESSDTTEKLPQMSNEEIQEYEIYNRLTDNRSLRASPSYKFKSDSFETVPKASDWFTYIGEDLSGGDIVKDLYKHISSIDVYNLPETKTNFIIVTMDDYTFIYQMYKSEATEEMTYTLLDTDNNDEAFIKVISDKGKKIYSKKNPDSLDLGQW